MKKSKRVAESQLKKLQRRSDRAYKKEELYQDTLELQREVNQRLKSLSYHHKSGTWASKTLINNLGREKLKAITTEGKVNIKKTMTTTQLNNINRGLQKFLRSKTSTHSGINKVKTSQLAGMKRTLDVTDEQASFLYEMLGDYSVRYLVDKIGASVVWDTINNAIAENDSEDEFLERLRTFKDLSNDEQLSSIASVIYDKYIS